MYYNIRNCHRVRYSEISFFAATHTSESIILIKSIDIINIILIRTLHLGILDLRRCDSSWNLGLLPLTLRRYDGILLRMTIFVHSLHSLKHTTYDGPLTSTCPVRMKNERIKNIHNHWTVTDDFSWKTPSNSEF